MSNSSLATYVHISPNRTPVRNKKNDTITIHCFVGQVTAKQGADYFAMPNAKSSANYVVGKDGSIALCVDEKDRAWTTGGNLTVNGETGSMNDRHAVTIEVACDKIHPYKITNAAYEALIKLVADIAKRNHMGKLKWLGNKSLVGKPNRQNMTVHRWFANKACPGDYIYQRLGDIAERANKINEGDEEEMMTQEQFNQMMDNYLNDLAKQPATWEKQTLAWAVANGLLNGDGTGNLMAKKFCTRGEMLEVIRRAMEKK